MAPSSRQQAPHLLRRQVVRYHPRQRRAGNGAPGFAQGPQHQPRGTPEPRAVRRNPRLVRAQDQRDAARADAARLREALQRLIKDEVPRWGTVVKDSGAKID